MTRRLVHRGDLRGAPVRVLDGGARGGAESHWHVYGDQLELIAFEPDQDECRRLTSAAGISPGGIRLTYEPVALGRSRGSATLNLTRFPASSSLLESDPAFTRRFVRAQDFERCGTVTVETCDVDSLMVQRGLRYVDFMKLDVEGLELDVLRGATRALEQSLLALQVEVWFHEFHAGRPLFGDIDTHLRGFGFTLFDLRDVNRWRRRTLSYPTRAGSGQLMYADALYLRDLPAQLETGRGPRPPSVAVMKLASLAELFCYPDFAVEVLESGERHGLVTAQDAEPLVRELRRRARGTTSDWRAVTRHTVRAAVPPSAREWVRRVTKR